MATDVTDSVHPIFLEPGAYSSLVDALQPLIGSSSLALVLLAGDVVAGDTSDRQRAIQAALDEIEQILFTNVRRTDMVMRCGKQCCALVLLDTGLEGAMCVVGRVRRCLDGWSGGAHPLQVGLAAMPEQATECEALIALASRPRLHLLPSINEEAATWDMAGKVELSGAVFSARQGGVARVSNGVSRERAPLLHLVPEPEAPADSQRSAKESGAPPSAAAFVQARARELGVPYLAPPQRIPSNVRNLLSAEVMQQLQCLPIGRSRSALTVALADPTDRGALRRLEQITGLTIFPVMTDPEALQTLARSARPRRAHQVAPLPASQGGD